MRLRTFAARDMPTAMKMVKDALGEDAVILSSESKKGVKGVTVTAAISMRDEMESGSRKNGAVSTAQPAFPPVSQISSEIQNVLRFHNIPEHFVSKISNHASRQEFVSLSALQHISANRDEKPLVRHALEKIIKDCFQFRPLEFNGHASRIMLVGPPGIGKTLTIAKLATRLSMEGVKCAVFTTDNQRAGGVEQLQAFTDILESPLYVTPTPEELSGTIQALPQDTHVLVDTAGCNPYNSAEMKQLKQLATQKGIEPIMVLPAGGDSAETIDIVEAFADLPIKRLLVTRADTARRFGSIVSAAAAHKLAFCHVSTSSSIVNSLDPMNGGTLAQLLLRYQLQTQ